MKGTSVEAKLCALVNWFHALVYWLLKWVFIGLPVRAFCRFEVEGEENLPRDGGVIISNHLSGFDPIALQVRLPIRISYVAKMELFEIPFLRWLMVGSDQIPLDRKKAAKGDLAEMKKLLRNAQARLSRGISVGLFPEGTRSPDGLLYAFMDGAGAIAIRAKKPIVPVGISYAWSWRKLGLVVRIVIGKPIDVSQYKPSEKGRFSAELRQTVATLSGQKLAEVA